MEILKQIFKGLKRIETRMIEEPENHEESGSHIHVNRDNFARKIT